MLEIRDHDRGVRELALARPPANALDPGLVAALAAAVAGAPAAGVRALVLSGRPGMFSAGLDVPVLLALERPAMERFLGDFLVLLRTWRSRRSRWSPALTGHSPAGGAVLAIHCDHRVMAEGGFKIGLNEVQVGLPMPRVIWSTLVRVVGAHQAERLAVGGVLLGAGEAREIGLVDELVAPELVVERALEQARDYVAAAGRRDARDARARPPRSRRRLRARGARDLGVVRRRLVLARRPRALCARWSNGSKKR